MLAKRLARQGLSFTVGSLVTALTQDAVACVPTSTVSSTIKAASLCAAGQAVTGVVTAKVANLMKGVLIAMLLTKLTARVALLVLMAAGVGIGVWVYAAQTGEPTTGRGQVKPAQKTALKNKEETPAGVAKKKPAIRDYLEDVIQPGDRLFIEVPGAAGDEPIKGVFR